MRASWNAARAAEAVGRIRFVEHGREYDLGTGFLVSPHLLLTNWHVLATKAEADQAIIEFNFVFPTDHRPAQTTKFALAPNRFFLFDKYLDFALVAVEPTPINGYDALTTFGFLPLIETQGKVAAGEPLNIIQHPNGEPKQLALRENKLFMVGPEKGIAFLHYQTDTAPGSSGSPVFNDQWEVVALHRSGVARSDGENYLTKYGTVWSREMGEHQLDWIANEGTRISYICEKIRAFMKSAANQEQRHLCEEIFAPTPHIPRERTQLAPSSHEAKRDVPVVTSSAASVGPQSLQTSTLQTAGTGCLPIRIVLHIEQGKAQATEVSTTTAGKRPSKPPPGDQSAVPSGVGGERPDTPPPTFECFAIEVSGATKKARVKALRDVIGAHLPGKWSFRIFGGAVLYYRVMSKTARPTVQQAWEWSYQLATDARVLKARPMFAVLTEPEPPKGPREEESSGGDDNFRPMPSDWSLRNTKVLEAWRLLGAKGKGKGIVIGHPDTGYYEHPELWPTDRTGPILAEKGINYVETDGSLPQDPLTGSFAGHGAATASVIVSPTGPAAQDASEPFVSGVAPDAQLIPFRVTDSVLLTSMANLTEAINDAVALGCHVISISLGGLWDSILHEAVQNATRQGVIILAAAGNKVRYFVVWPAAYKEVIAVTAVGPENRPWPPSSRGSEVVIAAPGHGVWRACPFDKDQTPEQSPRVAPSSGTSYAVATVAGAAALWLSYHDRDQLIEVYGAARLSAVFKYALEHDGYDDHLNETPGGFGKGILNVEKLLSAKLPNPAHIDILGISNERLIAPAEGHFGILTDMFPDVSRSLLRERLQLLLRTTEEALFQRISIFGDELLFQLSITPQLSAFLRHGPPPQLQESLGGAANTGHHPDMLQQPLSSVMARFIATNHS